LLFSLAVAAPRQTGASAEEAAMDDNELTAPRNERKIGAGGIRICGVQEHWAAARAGLLEGDVILAINGRPAADYGVDRLRALFGGDCAACLLTVQRGGKLLSARLSMRPTH
jgi:S1-C subfamily serine protease